MSHEASTREKKNQHGHDLMLVLMSNGDLNDIRKTCDYTHADSCLFWDFADTGRKWEGGIKLPASHPIFVGSLLFAFF